MILEFAWISVKKEKEGGKATSVYMVSFLHQLVLHCEVGVYHKIGHGAVVVMVKACFQMCGRWSSEDMRWLLTTGFCFFSDLFARIVAVVGACIMGR